nr:hypothetical protein [Nocardioides sp. SYSU D00038]
MLDLQLGLALQSLGGVVAVGSQVLVEVDDRFDGDRRAGFSAPLLDLGHEQGLAGGLEHPDVLVVEVDDDLPAGLAVRQMPEGDGASYVEGLVGVDPRGCCGERCFEVDRDRGVDDCVEVGDAVGAVGDGDVPLLGRLDPVGCGLVGVETEHGFVDQHLDLPRAESVGFGGEPFVDVRGAGLRQGHGLPGDEAGLPRDGVPGLHPVPEPGEPVAQLEGLGEVGPCSVRGDAEGDAELGDAELRDLGAAVPAEPVGLLAAGDGVEEGFAGVEVGPGARPGQVVGLEPGDLGAVAAQPVEHRVGGVEGFVLAGCHTFIQAPTTDSRTPVSGLSTRGSRTFSVVAGGRSSRWVSRLVASAPRTSTNANRWLRKSR